MDTKALYDDLTKRGLIDPKWALADGDKDEIVESDTLLAEVAGVAGFKTPLHAVIRERIRRIVKDLIFDAHPAEVMVLRQTILELAAVLDAFESYAAEYDKRKKPVDEGNNIGDKPPQGGGTTAEAGL